MVVAVSLAAAIFGTGCAASSSEDTGAGAGAQSVPASSLARSYEGTIGTLKVMARIGVSGSAISGTYFYTDKASNGDALVLSGNALGTKLTLTEAVNGTKTGAFDAKIGNGVITGTWKSANGATSLAVNLTAVKAGAPIVVSRQFKDATPAAAHGATMTTCESTASFIELFGLDSAAAENAINAKLAPAKIERDASGKCESAYSLGSTQKTTFNAQGIITIETTLTQDYGTYPDGSVVYTNFKTADGTEITTKDFHFAANARDKVGALFVKSLNTDARFTDNRQEVLDLFDSKWSSITSLDAIGFGLSDKGLMFDLSESYEHATAGAAPVGTLAWADVKPLLQSDSPILPLAK